MKFNLPTLQVTAEKFFRHTNEINIGIKSKSKSYDLWARILSGKNYSALSSRLSQKELAIEFELNTEIIIELFLEKQRVIDKAQAIAAFANSVADCFSDISEIGAVLAEFLKNNSSYSLIANHSVGIGIIEKTKPGYLPIDELSFSNYDRADDFNQLIFNIADLPLSQFVDVFAGMHRSINDLGNKEFKKFLVSHTNFATFLSKTAFENIKLEEEYSIVEAVVADSIGTFFSSNGVTHNDFLSINTPMVEDFVEGVAGSIMSTLDFYRYSEDDEVVYEEDSFSFVIQRKINFYIGEFDTAA